MRLRLFSDAGRLASPDRNMTGWLSTNQFTKLRFLFLPPVHRVRTEAYIFSLFCCVSLYNCHGMAVLSGMQLWEKQNLGSDLLFFAVHCHRRAIRFFEMSQKQIQWSMPTTDNTNVHAAPLYCHTMPSLGFLGFLQQQTKVQLNWRERERERDTGCFAQPTRNTSRSLCMLAFRAPLTSSASTVFFWPGVD